MEGGPCGVLEGWLVVVEGPAEGEGGVANREGGARDWRLAMVFGRVVGLLLESRMRRGCLRKETSEIPSPSSSCCALLLVLSFTG